jgi:hypothetical protein
MMVRWDGECKRRESTGRAAWGGGMLGATH